VRARPTRLCQAACAAVFAAAVVVPAAFLPSVAAASAATTWSALNPIDHQAPLGAAEPIGEVSCPTHSLCVGAGEGDIATTTDPGAVHGPASGWQLVNVDGDYPTVPADPTINAISCASATLCVAVDSKGNVLTSRSPTGGIPAWKVNSEDLGVDLIGVSCPSSSLCVAFGRGAGSQVTLTSTDPSKGAKAKWVAKTVSAFGTEGPSGISCPTTSLCVAAGSDNSGISAVWTSTDPKSAGTATWTAHEVGSTVGSGFLSVSCGATTACVAVGENGQAATSSDSSSGGSATWHNATIITDEIPDVSCASSTLCVAIDVTGNVFTSTNPTGASPTWVEKTGVLVAGDTVACLATPSFCVATGGMSKEDSTTDPADGATAVWTTTGYTATSEIDGVSCPSSSFCATADSAGNISTSTDPASKSAIWKTTNVNSGIAINPGGSYFLEDIACPSTALCVAVDSVGNVLTSTNPLSGSPTWTAAKADNAGGFTAITCPSTSLCVAVDFAGDAVVSTDPTGGAGAWTTTPIDDGLLVHYESVSCPTSRECFAGMDGGGVTVIHLTAGGALSTSSTTAIDEGISLVNGISCPTTSMCVAADSLGNIVESTKPAGPASGWKKVKVDIAGSANPTNELDAISCSSAKHCVAVDAVGNAISTSAPKGPASGWKVVHADPLSPLNSVSCPTASLCVAVDDTGNATVGHTGAAGLAISSAKLPSASAGTKYHKKLSATGGTGPYHWKKTSGSLPAGLKLSAKGVISGKPHAAGTSKFTIKVTDSAKHSNDGTKKYKIAVK
jgi:putative Ig domain-containing protein